VRQAVGAMLIAIGAIAALAGWNRF